MQVCLQVGVYVALRCCAVDRCRYCFKAPDRVSVELNEIQAYLSGRLLSCSEATFRILGLRLHQEWPSVERLEIHLPRHHNVVFNPLDDEDEVHERLLSTTSKLLQWFELNREDPNARQWRYIDIPEHYSWDKQRHQWKRRVNVVTKVARLPQVSASNLELAALRLILHYARGCGSFEDLATFNGHTYDSFRDAAKAAGLVEDDSEAVIIFQEIVRTRVCIQTLREQFCAVLVHCGPSNPVELFNMFASDLMYDSVSSASCRSALLDINTIMREQYGKSLNDREFGFDLDFPDDDVMLPPIVDIDSNTALLEVLRPLLSQEQKIAIQCVLNSVFDQQGSNVFAVLCSAGTGKTLFANFLACYLRSQGYVVVCVAASALAASLLEGGHTAHHAFHIPIPANDGTFCSLTRPERALLRKADLIIWDEASMIHQDVADTVCRSLQDIMHEQLPFGGKTVVFTGDFKQLLPVVRCGNGAHHTLHRCSWWPRVACYSFSRNFRADQDEAFAAMLEDVGRGLITTVNVPEGSCAGSITELVARVFGDNLLNVDANAMILTWTLDAANTINEYCLQHSPGVSHEAFASDTYMNCKNPDLYPTEVVASIHMYGAPSSCIRLKVGARYMIIKNVMKNVFNGVRCQLVALNGNKSVFVKLLSGPGAGVTVLLPSCVFMISPEASGLPFVIRRRQFPLIPAYAVTAHKAQGQTLCTVGLYIASDVFTHGQAYTALSRTRGWPNIVVFSTLQNPRVIHNCVNHHVLDCHTSVPSSPS